MEALPDAPVWRGHARLDYIAAPAPEWVDPSELRRAKEEKNRLDARIESSNKKNDQVGAGCSIFSSIALYLKSLIPDDLMFEH
jgi:hypothetical protein